LSSETPGDRHLRSSASRAGQLPAMRAADAEWLRRFLVAFALIAFAFAVVEAAASVAFDSHGAGLAAGSSLATGLGLLGARVLVRRGVVEGPVLLVAGSMVAAGPLFALAIWSPVALALVPLVAVAIGFRYLGRRAIAPLAAIAWLAALVTTALQEYLPPYEVAPGDETAPIRIAAVGVAVAVVFILVGEARRRLLDALAEATGAREQAADAEARLRRSFDLLNAVADGTTDAIYVKDRGGRYLLANRAAAAVVGRRPEELIDRDDRDLFPPDAAAAFMADDRATIERGETRIFEEAVSFGGEPRIHLTTKGVYRDERGEVAGVFGVSRDVTDLRRSEERLREAQRLEAVGRLAGGIAHSFNNRLQAIGGHAQMLMAALDPADPRREDAIAIREATDSAALLTHRLLTFSRRQPQAPQVVGPNPVLADLEPLLRGLVGEAVKLWLVLEPTAPEILIDPAQVERLVVELVLNAHEAMPHGGTLTVASGTAALDAAAAAEVDLPAGDYVALSVSDTGAGMDEATRARAFEPFFTTRAFGEGAGMGLAAVHGVARGAGGGVRLQSEPGRGTTVTIYLPPAAARVPDVRSS